MITKLLLDKIYQPLEISSFISFVDIIAYLITAISLIQAVDLNPYQPSPYNYKQSEWPNELATLGLPKYFSKIEERLDNSKALYLD